MSDKMLMEDWRKFLKERFRTEDQYFLDKEIARKRAAEDTAIEPAEEEAVCYTLSDLINYIEDKWKIGDRKKWRRI